MSATTAPTVAASNSVQKKTNKSEETKENKDPIVYQVYETTNYKQFTLLIDNRDINKNHVQRLLESFQEKYLVSPLIVNEKFQVIDGQHRLAAAIEAGVPVLYIMVPHYSIHEVQVFNANQKNWTKMDFLQMWVARGKEAYLQFAEFMKDFPALKFQACEMLLTGARGAKTKHGTMDRSIRDFQEGKLKIPSIHQSYKSARMLMEFAPFFPDVSRREFVSAVLPLFKSKRYDHKEMIYKLGVAPKQLLPQTNTAKYREALEDIYNWKRQKENKVSFKYIVE